MGFKLRVPLKYRVRVFYEYMKYLYYGNDKTQDYLIKCVPRSLFLYYLSHKTQHYEKGCNAIDKWRFYQLMKENELKIPATYAIKINGKFIDLDNNNVDINNLPEKTQFFVKPFGSSAGASAKKMTKDELQELEDGMIIQEVLRNHGSIRDICGESSSLNTIRIHTYYSTILDEVYILNAHLKIGVPGSSVDTFGMGIDGVGVMIDIENGKLHEVGFNGKNGEKAYQAYSGGPLFKNCNIDEWSSIKNYVNKASKIIGTQFIGWDITVVNYGVIAVEANSGSDHAAAQTFFDPFLMTPYISDFIVDPDYHKWVKKWKDKACQKYPEIMEKLYSAKHITKHK